MTILLIIAICIVAILLVIMTTIRVRLKKQSERLSEKVSRISSYENIITNNDKKEGVSVPNEKFSYDVVTDLETSFENHYITFRQEKAFIRLIATFVTLLKSSCRTLKEVLKQADKAGDQRSEFVIKNIFRPVYERYEEALRNNGEIDFTFLLYTGISFIHSFL